MRTIAKRSPKGMFYIQQIARQRPPWALKPWLYSTGSLSQEIATHYGQFSVQCLQQSIVSPYSHCQPGLPSRAQIRLGSCYYWRREVLLYGDNRQQPIVHALTLVPVPALAGKLRQLRSLRSQSLGTLLFARGKLSGSRMLHPSGNNWTRANCYHWRGQRLWVFETFLPSFNPV